MLTVDILFIERGQHALLIRFGQMDHFHLLSLVLKRGPQSSIKRDHGCTNIPEFCPLDSGEEFASSCNTGIFI